MAVQDAFWIAGRTGGVAEGRGGRLGEGWPAVRGISVLDEIFVGRPIVRAPIVEHEHTFDRLQARQQLARQRNEHRIDEQHAGCRVFENVDNLLFEQPRIDRVQDRADPGDAVEQFEVPVSVHRERRYAIAAADPCLEQRARELSRPPPGVGVGVAMLVALRIPRHDLARGMIFLGVADEVADHQLLVLHQSRNGTHRDFLLSGCRVYFSAFCRRSGRQSLPDLIPDRSRQASSRKPQWNGSLRQRAIEFTCVGTEEVHRRDVP
jgi:hypothetical protein